MEEAEIRREIGEGRVYRLLKMKNSLGVVWTNGSFRRAMILRQLFRARRILYRNCMYLCVSLFVVGYLWKRAIELISLWKDLLLIQGDCVYMYFSF